MAGRLGATPTAGSGAVFRDGDMRLRGRFLVEHKYRRKDAPKIPRAFYEEIRRKADQRGLIAALIVTTKKSQDFAVLSHDDAQLLLGPRYRLTPLTPGRGFATIRIDPDLHHDATALLRVDGCVPCADLVMTHGRGLCLMTLDDFKICLGVK